jgi:CDGSH-type Zn-finger protein
MSKPVVAQKSPYAIDVEAGKTYFWCTCGLSAKQPFCDGKHKEAGMRPQKWEAPESKTVYFCGCKQTGNAPLCDGTHSKIA